MKRLLCLAALLCLLLSAACGESAYVPTAEWQPPVIDEQEALASAPWLLVLKVAQEEVGYVEGPAKDESKYGAWFGDRITAWCAEFCTWCVNEADSRYGTAMLHTLFPFYGKPVDGAPWYIQRERFVCAGTRVPVSHEKMWLVGADRYIKNKEYVPQPGDYLWTAELVDDNEVHALIRGDESKISGVIGTLFAAGLTILSFDQNKMDLEELFLKITKDKK